MKATLELIGYIGDADTIIAIGFFVISRRGRFRRIVRYVSREIRHAQRLLADIYGNRMPA